MKVAWLLVFLSALGGSECANILAASPFPSISHVYPMRAILLELVRRGHTVTYITTGPMKKPVQNLTEIDISSVSKYWVTSYDWMERATREWDPVDMLEEMKQVSFDICEGGLKTPEMIAFIKSAPRFDLYIVERALVPCFCGLAHVVGSPAVVGLVTLAAYPYQHWTHGNVDNPAYLPSWLLPYSDHMTLWQRLHSTFFWLYFNYLWFYVMLPRHDVIQKNSYGPGVPSIFELEKNYSVTLIASHFTDNYVRPNLPNFVELTGLHIETETKPLPKDIQDWLDEGTEGVVYFSLGSNVLSSTMTPDKRRAFRDAFSRLPQRVLWKWENDNATDLPPNVKVCKWIPQQSVLAHPNVKAFITQGGMQSFNEGMYYGVPFIGIPFMGDQIFNVAKMVTAGVGYRLHYKDVTKDTVLEAVQTVLNDPKYQKNMKKLSAVYRDHQAVSLPQAIWWIEYVLRHEGATHLRSAAMDLSWYQQLLLDVIAIVLAAVAISVFAIYSLARYLTSVLIIIKKEKTL